MKIGIILGTRPEIIKLFSILRFLQNQDKIRFFVIHSNQHYSDNMDKIFFEQLSLQPSKYNLNISGSSQGKMVGEMIIAIEDILITEKPDIVIVQGDTNTVLAGGLAAVKIGCKVAHVEAGLRSYDRSMPEEVNRIVTDHLSDFLFPPTEKQCNILLGEGIDQKSIFVTGNTIVDAVYETYKISQGRELDTLDHHKIVKNNYIFFTTHRPSNVDNEKSLRSILESLKEISHFSGKKIYFPIHPRTLKNINSFGLNYLLQNFITSEPVGFIENIILQKNSYMIVTDSGGIQEEACILEKKTLVLRNTTERPETLDVGGAILVGNQKSSIVAGYKKMESKFVDWYNPFGDGKSGERIISIIEQKLL